MKFIFLTLVFIVSCIGNDFKVGECIQRPDKPIIWKVESFSKNELRLSNQSNKSDPIKTIKNEGTWSKVDCI